MNKKITIKWLMMISFLILLFAVSTDKVFAFAEIAIPEASLDVIPAETLQGSQAKKIYNHTGKSNASYQAWRAGWKVTIAGASEAGTMRNNYAYPDILVFCERKR